MTPDVKFKAYTDDAVTMRPPDLPDFGEPPVDEVAIAVRFAPLENFSNAHMGLFWDRIRSEYPRVQDQARIEAQIEPLVSPSLSGVAAPITFQIPGMISGIPSARLWMISEDDSYVVQIQNGGFIQNWRRRSDEYPRFEAVRDLFWSNYSKFLSFLTDENLGEPSLQQLELTYVNWMGTMPVTTFLRAANEGMVNAPYVEATPEDQMWGARYFIKDGDDPVGRLTVECQPAIRGVQPAPGPGYQLSLTFRSPAQTRLIGDGLLKTLQIGRSVIVNAFTELTTDSAHQAWGRKL